MNTIEEPTHASWEINASTLPTMDQMRQAWVVSVRTVLKITTLAISAPLSVLRRIT
jgi:hypothetical protein